MTDAEIRDAAVAELEKTTDSYPTWVRKGRPASSHWAKAFGFLAQIGALPPPPSGLTVKGMYDANSGRQATDWPTIAGLGFNLLITAAADTAGLAAVKATGGKAWVSCGSWTGTGFSTTDSQAAAMARAAFATGVVAGLYVADEPSYSQANVTAVRMRAQLLKQVCPVETLIAYYDAATLAKWKGAVDAFALDIYPSSHNWDMSLIPKLAAAADQAGLRYYGVIGCDGAPNYPMPTAAQLQTMIDLWKATKQAGWLVYAWDSPGQLKNQAALLDVLKANA